jgi:uncharacterized membrane protein YdjX (TVP38/TMEM64 family)
MADPIPRPNRALLFKLAAGGIVLLLVAGFVARGLDLKALLQHGLDLIQGAGPVAFFAAMAVLPALGAPLSAFSLTAGSVFGQQLGMGWVIALALLAITVNMALSYYLARHALRPLLVRLFTRLGYRLPQAGAEDETDLIILLRVTPGVPFPVQNYLLGLAGMSFGKYLFLSSLITWPINAAFILFGDALLHGKGKVAVVTLSLILALMAATQLVRKHYGKKGA